MTNNNSLKEFVAKQIRHLRLEKGLTQEYLAEKLNVKIDTIEKIMKALQVDVNTFFNVETQNRENEFNQLIQDIENLPKEKREPTIKALRDIIKQIE